MLVDKIHKSSCSWCWKLSHRDQSQTSREKHWGPELGIEGAWWCAWSSCVPASYYTGWRHDHRTWWHPTIVQKCGQRIFAWWSSSETIVPSWSHPQVEELNRWSGARCAKSSLTGPAGGSLWVYTGRPLSLSSMSTTRPELLPYPSTGILG